MKQLFGRLSIPVLARLSLVSFALLAQHPAFADDKQSIVGTWRGEMPGDPPGSIELTITPTKISGRNPKTGESLGEGPYEIDPSRHTIDARKDATFGRGKNYVGIYSLQGDTLRWCSNSRGKKRPTDLAHRPDRDQFLMVLRRQQ